MSADNPLRKVGLIVAGAGTVVWLVGAFLFGENFRHGASIERWLGLGAFLLISAGIVFALIKDVVARFLAPPERSSPSA